MANEILLKVLLTAVGFITTGVLGYLVAKVKDYKKKDKNEKEEQELIKKGLMMLLQSNLTNVFYVHNELGYIEDYKLKNWYNELKEYEYFKKKTEKLLKKNKVDVPSTNIFAKISSDLGIKMETIKDNSDSAIGSMLIEGMTMGITSITSKIKVYQESTQKNILKLAKEYVEFQEKEIDKIKTFM